MFRTIFRLMTSWLLWTTLPHWWLFPGDLLSWSAVVPAEDVFQQAFMILNGHGLFGNQILPELRTALINSDGMSNRSCRGFGRVRELGASHPSRLELWNAVHAVEKPDEFDPLGRTGEGFAEPLHELELVPFGQLFFLRMLSSHLPSGECFPCEMQHLLVTGTQESDVVCPMSANSPQSDGDEDMLT